MGCVQQAVLEFDESVRAPWRPRLVPETGVTAAAPVDAAHSSAPLPARPQPSRRNPSRVGACRPVARPGSGLPAAGPARRAPGPGRVPVPGGPAARAVRGGRVHGRPGVARVRLTRRARRLKVVLVLAAGVALGSWLGPLVTGGGGDGLRLAGESSVVVESGDTLWSIASSVAGGQDVRDVVGQIRRLNELDSADLMPGQVLQLP
jgi:nucleoid-associated protein YgaU